MQISRRSFLTAGGVLIVGLGLDGLGQAQAQTVPDADRFLGKPLVPDAVDSFLAVHADGSVTVFVGKVDIGTGGRIAMRQIVGEELDVPLERIAMIEGDTALTPNQGATAGSYGIARGGAQLRQAAATARQALLAQAAQRLNRPAGDLQITDGVVSAKDGSASVSYGDLLGDRAFNVKIDIKAPLIQARGDAGGHGHGGGGGASHRTHPRDAGGMRSGLRAHDQPGVRAEPARGEHHPDAFPHSA